MEASQRKTPPEDPGEAKASPESNGHAPDSVLASLRKRREQIGQAHECTLEIPGYGGELFCRYKKLEFDDIQRISRRTQESKNPLAALNGQADFLIQACETLLIKKPDGTTVPMQELYPELGDEPIRFDDRLGKALGYEASSARQAVLGLFNNDLALNDQANDLMLWMRSSEREVEEDFTKRS